MSTSSRARQNDRPCPWCGDWPDDEDRVGIYCRWCEAERERVYRARRRRAKLSTWFAEVRTADAERAAMLASAIVDELGGYDRAAQQLVRHVLDIAAGGKAPAQSLRQIEALLRLIRLSLPPGGGGGPGGSAAAESDGA